MSETDRIVSLDGLRGIAASAVVYAHLEFFYPTANPWITLDTGNPAVAIFFSLSGFLMALLYGQRRFDAADYLVHRFSRIYPVYVVSVLSVVALTTLTHGAYIHPIEGAQQLVRHMLMLGSTGVFWSIPPEIQFYLFFLLVWLFFLEPVKYQWVVIATALYLLIDAYFGFPGPGILLTSKLPYFLFGAVAGRFFTIFRFRPDGALTGIATLALLAFFYLAPGLFPIEGKFWGLTSALTAAVIVYLAACDQKISAAILGSAPLRYVGKISFSLYLFHLPVMYLSMKLFSPFMTSELALSLSIGVAYLIASLSYYVIEDPSRRFLVGLWKSRRRKFAVAAE